MQTILILPPPIKVLSEAGKLICLQNKHGVLQQIASLLNLELQIRLDSENQSRSLEKLLHDKVQSELNSQKTTSYCDLSFINITFLIPQKIWIFLLQMCPICSWSK